MKGKTLAKARLKAVGFDPLTIITILLPLIAQCLRPTPAKLRNRTNRPALVRELRKADPSLTLKAAREKANTAFDEADAATDEELQSFIDDCKK